MISKRRTDGGMAEVTFPSRHLQEREKISGDKIFGTTFRMIRQGATHLSCFPENLWRDAGVWLIGFSLSNRTLTSANWYATLVWNIFYPNHDPLPALLARN